MNGRGQRQSWEQSCNTHPALQPQHPALLTLVFMIKPGNPKGNQPWIFFGRTDWSRSSNILATWCEEPTHWKRPWWWDRLRVGGEGENRGQDGWMASLTQWAWVSANSGKWWRTGKPGVLQSIRWQRVRQDWATEQVFMNMNAGMQGPYSGEQGAEWGLR